MFLMIREKYIADKSKMCVKHRVFKFFLCARDLAQNSQPLSFAEKPKKTHGFGHQVYWDRSRPYKSC